MIAPLQASHVICDRLPGPTLHTAHGFSFMTEPEARISRAAPTQVPPASRHAAAIQPVHGREEGSGADEYPTARLDARTGGSQRQSQVRRLVLVPRCASPLPRRHSLSSRTVSYLWTDPSSLRPSSDAAREISDRPTAPAPPLQTNGNGRPEGPGPCQSAASGEARTTEVRVAPRVDSVMRPQAASSSLVILAACHVCPGAGGPGAGAEHPSVPVHPGCTPSCQSLGLSGSLKCQRKPGLLSRLWALGCRPGRGL